MIFYLTFGELESWLTLKPLKQLRMETAIDVEIRPILGSLGNVVSQAKPGEVDPLAEYKARRAAARQQANQREQARQCDRLGITIGQAEREIDPTMLSLGLLWMNQGPGDCADYCYRAFRQTFRDITDVESLPAVVALISAAGTSAEGFGDFVNSERGALIDETDLLLEQGLLSAPAFVLEGETFHGREHLPLIRWMLKGRVGTPPV